MRRPPPAAAPGRRREPPAKRKRRRLLLSRRPVGFSPFFRSLSRRLLYPVPAGRFSLASRDEAPSRATPPSQHLSSAHRGIDPSPPEPSSSSSDDGDLEDEEDEEDEEEQDMVDTVQVDFVFCNPEPGDFHGVKLLLRSYLGDRQWDLGGFVDLILEQTTVGTVVKSEEPEGGDDEEDDEDECSGVADDDEEGLYAVITVINLGKYASCQCIGELKKYLIEVCHDDAVKNTLQPMFEGGQAHKAGLLVCERFVNFPLQPVPRLYNFLFDEISQSTKDESTKEIHDSFCFEFYLTLTRIFMKKDTDVGKGRSRASLGKKSRSSNSHTGSSENDDSVIYTKAEDEIFHKLCSSSFTFDLSRNEQFVPPELKNYKEMGLVMVIESSKVPSFLKEVESFLSET